MGIYRDHVLPRITDKMLSTGEIMKYRGQTCEGLHGRVLEIGFGSGLNIEKYPPEVTHVQAVDPSILGRRLAADRIEKTSIPIEFVGLDGEDLPLDDESCDSAVSTFTLCTIPDVEAALGEIERVLKPGAAFHVLEHGLAREEGVVRSQRWLEPVQKRVGGGCHLTRDHEVLLRDAGFEIGEMHEFYPRRAIKPLAAFYRGVARKPAA